MAFTDDEIADYRKRHGLNDDIPNENIRVFTADNKTLTSEQRRADFFANTPLITSTVNGGLQEVIVYDPEAEISTDATSVYTEYTGGAE